MVAQTRKAGQKVYTTHANGSRPFTVIVKGNSVAATKNMDTFKIVDGKFVEIPRPAKPLFSMEVKKVFVGKKSPKGGYDGLTPRQAEGNSLLLELKSGHYRYIGSEIYDFSLVAGDEILQYYSNIGNNDVPYPYAVGKTHIYLMLEKKAVEKSYFDMGRDVYEQAYIETYARDCKMGFGKKEVCKDPEGTRERIKELKKKSVSMKVKRAVKGL